MEDKVLNIFDSLEIEEAEKLLNCDVSVKIDKKSKARVRKMVFEKAGFHAKKTVVVRRSVACAATVALLLTVTSVVGFDNVQAAISRIFSFVPGVGIIESNNGNDRVKYCLSDPVTAENEDARLTINSAVATENSITVVYTLYMNNASDQPKIENQPENKEGKKNKITLPINNSQPIIYSEDNINHTVILQNEATFTLKPEEISEDATYELTHKGYDVSLDFTLKECQTYSDLNQIGATGCYNDISLTAVPTYDGDHVEVELYAINKSNYRIESYGRVFYAYQGKEINLVTESGTKSYASPNYSFDIRNKFNFNVKSTDKNFTLNVPYLIVCGSEDEGKYVSLPIPKDGQEIDVNKEIEFEDGTMTIVSVKKIPKYSDDRSALQMNIKYKNKKSNLILFNANLNRVDNSGAIQDGGKIEIPDDSGINSQMYFYLEEGDKDTLKLKLSEPQYYLTDEYNLKFERK